ncbi:MAG: VanZ family protein [Planctomycetes bacterium]|nr:VanZ family protein [Planctomycetota bacterium]
MSSQSGRFRRSILPAVLWSAVLAYSALIIMLSSRPAPERLRVEIPGFDKALHAAAFGVWAALFLGALASSRTRWSYRRLAVWTLAAAALFGASDEIHQAFVPGRSADVLDWAADVAGAAALLLGLAALCWRRMSRESAE